MRRLVPVLAFAALLAGWPGWHCASAQAAFKPFELVSASTTLQAEYAYEPAVSADGRYVVFTGVVGSKHGVYRKNLVTEELATVALGNATGAPSVSADGRYVSFTTADDPSTGREPVRNGCTQVYVRDMARGRRQPEGPEGLASDAGEFRLASARDGSEEPLAYEGTEREGCPGGGSAAAAGVALSADGTRVAFTTLGPSDLTAKPGEQPGAIATPPNQVALRDLTSSTTTLISTLRGSPEPVPGGAALSDTPTVEEVKGKPVAREAASTAAVSADGNAVAWMGINVQAQDETALNGPSFLDEYAEPLWREVAAGTSQPAGETRRVLAGDDPSARLCPPECAGGLDLHWDQQHLENYTGLGPQFGSYISDGENGFHGSALGDVTPQLSADGSKVALLSTQPGYGHLPNFGNLPPDKSPTANAFVVDMAPGLTREQSITRLTEWASPNFGSGPLDSAIAHIAISADGTRVLFATSRSAFPLAPPALITAPISQFEPVSQLYEVNLRAGTLALVSQGYDGEPANNEQGSGGVGAAALSADGRVIALASGSSNLSPGSVNDGSDVFYTEEEHLPELTGTQSVTALPPGPGGETGWSLSVTARPGPRGALLIDVSVPGPGRLAASASALVPTAVRAKSRSRRRSTRAHKVIAARQVAHAAGQAGGEGLFELRLAPSNPYRSLASAKAGLYATVVVTFSAPGHRTLNETLQASFPHLPSVARRAAKTKPKRNAAGKAGGRT